MTRYSTQIEMGTAKSCEAPGRWLQTLKRLVRRSGLSACRHHDQRSAQGFTLIELLVVIAIVGILGAIAYPAYLNFSRKAAYAAAKHQMGIVARELRTIEFEKQSYPADTDPNIVPTGVQTWPNSLPYNSTLDYDNWAIGNGLCYVQLAFWGDKNERHYADFVKHAEPGTFAEVEGNLLLGIAIYNCSQANAGPVN
ncbi:hypothetical protein C7271_16450 [filamentous cyanobacterium CCP5]|nr:hypothetical protein C7271_16450 [filamentous cyanobacterium CCP5]